jgi:DNA-binding XRE family transcriptional regulator
MFGQQAAVVLRSILAFAVRVLQQSRIWLAVGDSHLEGRAGRRELDLCYAQERAAPMKPDQCGEARVLLNWDEWKLANHAGLSEQTVRNLEAGSHRPHPRTLAAIRAALEAAGVIFVAENGDGPGVRLRKSGP